MERRRGYQTASPQSGGRLTRSDLEKLIRKIVPRLLRKLGSNRFLADVATGTTDLDAGRVVTTDELKRLLGLDEDPVR